MLQTTPELKARVPSTASISRTHSQCQRWSSSLLPRANPRIRFPHSWKVVAATTPPKRQWWWSQSGSNRRPQACKASALPTELWPHWIKPLAMVGRVGVEPTTSRLSGVRSNHLSYRPPQSPAGLMAAGGVSQLRLHSPKPLPAREAFPG